MLKLVRMGRKEEAFYTFDWVSEGGYSKNGYFVLSPCSSNITYCKLILEAIHPKIRGREWGSDLVICIPQVAVSENLDVKCC